MVEKNYKKPVMGYVVACGRRESKTQTSFDRKLWVNKFYSACDISGNKLIHRHLVLLGQTFAVQSSLIDPFEGQPYAPGLRRVPWWPILSSCASSRSSGRAVSADCASPGRRWSPELRMEWPKRGKRREAVSRISFCSICTLCRAAPLKEKTFLINTLFH